MIAIALPGALLVGLSLGLLGSGGSILTVPILVYLLGQDEKVAIASSLAIVGVISIVGSLPYLREKVVDWRSVVLFGIPGIIGTYAGAGLSQLASGELQMIVFAAVMLLAAWFMLHPIRISPRETRRSASKVGLEGFIVGTITGFVGVGGGFLIVPALVFLGGLAMQQAVATSLVIIALKSLAGFIKYSEVIDALNLHIDYGVITFFAIAGIIGSLAGGLIARRLPQEQLKRGFGVFLLVIAGFVLYQTVPDMIAGSPV